MIRLPNHRRLKKANDIHKAINGDGTFDRLVQQTIEECAELQAVLARFSRQRSTKYQMVEEIADVLICVDALLDFCPKEIYKTCFRNKVSKYLRQMRKAKSKKRSRR